MKPPTDPALAGELDEVNTRMFISTSGLQRLRDLLFSIRLWVTASTVGLQRPRD